LLKKRKFVQICSLGTKVTEDQGSGRFEGQESLEIYDKGTKENSKEAKVKDSVLDP
jgi:hypothetical protein